MYVVSRLLGTVAHPNPAVQDPGEVRSVAWALSHDAPLEPLVVFSGSKIVYVLNVQRRSLISSLRGHGGVCTVVSDLHTL
jgi:hypothetical protein